METSKKGELTEEQIKRLLKNETQQSHQQEFHGNRPQQSPLQQEKHDNLEQSVENNKTYFSYKSPDGSLLEIDLVTFREKGSETRYLSFATIGIPTQVAEGQPTKVMLSIDTREDFESIKQFFSELNWED